MDNIKVKINEKERSVRFNPKKVCFECNVGYKDNQFKQQSRIIRGASIDELSENVKAFEDRLKQELITTQNTTFGAFAEYYFSTIAPIENSEPTLENKKSAYRSFPDEIKRTELKKLTAQQLQSFYSERYKTNTINTVHYYFEVISAILNCAVKLGYLQSNPNKLCSVKPLENVEKVYWSVDTCKSFLKFIRENKKYQSLYKPILFIMVTGVRRGEALGVKYEYVNYERCLVRLGGQITDAKKSKAYQEKLKTKQSRRTVAVPAQIFTEIFGEKHSDNTGLVFLHKGEQWHAVTFSRIAKEAFTDFGYPNMKIKHLRSSFVKTQIKCNTPLKAIQVMLGHSKLSTTADIYGELTNEDTFQYADNMLAVWN